MWWARLFAQTGRSSGLLRERHPRQRSSVQEQRRHRLRRGSIYATATLTVDASTRTAARIASAIIADEPTV